MSDLENESSIKTSNNFQSVTDNSVSGKSYDWRKDYISSLKVIGRGYFSKVYQATSDNSSKSFAAKVIRRQKSGIDQLQKIRQEASLLILLNSLEIGSIVQLFDVYESVKDVVLILELAKGGSLFMLVEESIRGLDHDYVKVITHKLLLALGAMHKENIVHLDIKADNILLRKPYPSTDIVLCDFGLATQLIDGESHRELVGTPDYIAPEVVNYENISVNTDMWSVGVLVYYLLTKQSPFNGATKNETLSNVSKVNITFDSVFSEPPYDIARDFISCLCVKSPEARLSATAAQNHIWFANLDDIDLGGFKPLFDTDGDFENQFMDFKEEGTADQVVKVATQKSNEIRVAMPSNSNSDSKISHCKETKELPSNYSGNLETRHITDEIVDVSAPSHNHPFIFDSDHCCSNGRVVILPGQGILIETLDSHSISSKLAVVYNTWICNIRSTEFYLNICTFGNTYLKGDFTHKDSAYSSLNEEK